MVSMRFMIKQQCKYTEYVIHLVHEDFCTAASILMTLQLHITYLSI